MLHNFYENMDFHLVLGLLLHSAVGKKAQHKVLCTREHLHISNHGHDSPASMIFECQLVSASTSCFQLELQFLLWMNPLLKQSPVSRGKRHVPYHQPWEAQIYLQHQ